MKLCVGISALLACAAAVYIDPSKPERRPGDPIGCFEYGVGDFALPDNNGCNQEYVACQEYGYFQILPCPHGGYYFDQYSGRCLIKEYVYACGGTHTDPQPQPEPIPHDDTVDCYGIDVGTKLLPEELRGTCQDYYYECVPASQYAVRRQCADETYFDEKYMDCIDHYENFACSGGTRKPYSSTPAPDEIDRVYLEDFVCKWGAGNYRHPDYKCSPYYVVCDTYGVAELVPCPGFPYTFYDAGIEACGHFYDVPDCSGKDRPVPEPSTRRPKLNVDYDCSAVADGNYAFPYGAECTSQYVACVRHDVRDLVDCPYGTIYVPDEDRQGRCVAGHCPSYQPEPEPVYPAPYYPEPEPVYPAPYYPEPEPVYPEPVPEPVPVPYV